MLNNEVKIPHGSKGYFKINIKGFKKVIHNLTFKYLKKKSCKDRKNHVKLETSALQTLNILGLTAAA